MENMDFLFIINFWNGLFGDKILKMKKTKITQKIIKTY